MKHQYTEQSPENGKVKCWIALTSPRVKLPTPPISITLTIWPAKLPKEGTVPNLFFQTWLLDATSTSSMPLPKCCCETTRSSQTPLSSCHTQGFVYLRCCGRPGLSIFRTGGWETRGDQQLATGLWEQEGKSPLFDPSVSREESS